MQVSIKLEGVENIHKLFVEKGTKIIAGGEKIIAKHMNTVLQNTRSKIKNRTGQMGSILKARIDGKGKNFVVAQMGTLDASKEEAIAWNSYEYGHAAPNDAGGVKIVQGSGVMRTSLEEDKKSFKNDMQKEIQSVIESR